jgi:ankyrin repeat protein
MIQLTVTSLRKHSLLLGFLALLACLLAGTRANAQGDDLFTAASKGDLRRVKALLTDNPNLLFSKDGLGQTLLHHAAEGYYTRTEDVRVAGTWELLYEAPYESQPSAVVEFLLANKLDVNAKDKGGLTPLHLASNGRKAELLLAHGADVNARDDGRRTPLHNAAFSGFKDVMAVLLAHKADVNAKDSGGITPLLINDLYTDIARLLLAAKADVNAKDREGQTSLYEAAYYGNKDMVALLLAHAADVNAKDNNGRTPLNAAEQDPHHEDVVELLRQHGGQE